MPEQIDSLAARAFGGDKQAWKSLYDGLTPRLWGLFRHWGASEAEREDLIQETWVRVLRKHHQFDPSRPFEPYLFVIANRLWIDACRRTGRQRTEHHLPEDEPLDAALPMDWLFAAERSEEIRRSLGDLSDEEVTIVVLRFWQDLTNREIAERLGASEPSVRSKGHRALKKLSKLLDAS